MATYTLTNLPASGRLYVYVTGEQRTAESVSEGMADAHGWIDWDYSPTTLEESRNYVRPLVSVNVADIRYGRDYGNGLTDTPEEIREEILSAIREVIGYADFSENGTIYPADEIIWDYSSPYTYMYAVHVFVLHNTTRGYVESPVEIPTTDINKD
jgi:hypothetical protein